MFTMRPYSSRNDGMTYYDPFRELREMERRFFGEPFGFSSGRAMAAFRADITDHGDNFLLEADLPGFDKKDIQLTVDGDTLTIKAERRSEQEEKDKEDNYICRERSYGSYSRAFDVSAVDTSGITAKYTDGVLRLILPKKGEQTSAARQLEIE